MVFYVSYHRYSRMLNYLLSYIVFHEWKCGAIKTFLKGWASLTQDLLFFLSLVQEFPFWQVILCLCRRFYRMINHLLSDIVFHKWKSGAIWRNLKWVLSLDQDVFYVLSLEQEFLFWSFWHFILCALARCSIMPYHLLHYIVFQQLKSGASRRHLKRWLLL